MSLSRQGSSRHIEQRGIPKAANACLSFIRDHLRHTSLHWGERNDNMMDNVSSTSLIICSLSQLGHRHEKKKQQKEEEEAEEEEEEEEGFES